MGAALARVLDAQRPQFALWCPVLIAGGIGAFFAWPVEPSRSMVAGIGGVAVLALMILPALPRDFRWLPLLVLLPAIGVGVASLRSRSVAAPILVHEMTRSFEGRLVAIDRSVSDRTRLTLDEVVIHGLPAEETPARLRVSLEPGASGASLRPGGRLMGQARLSPPAAPAEPHGFDFRRLAWFDRIGAVGYTRSPVVATYDTGRGGLRQLPFRARMAASAHIQAQIAGQPGAFSAAILTGDRSGIDRSVEAALRASGLYHIVSISGLHMSLLAASVFAIVRHGLALAPRVATAWPLKKIAAVIALAAAGGYLILSGNEVPAQRSYIMTGCVLVAVLIDRPAFTMRSIALAALIILLLAPESLTEPGAQMSFAATAAMVAAYDSLRGRDWWLRFRSEPGLRWLGPIAGIALTSLIAGLATGPIAAFHFNSMPQYGFVANLAAVPLMAMVVMPAAVVGAMLAPVGLDWLPFQVVGLGMNAVIEIAVFFAGLGGAQVGIPSGPPASLGLIGGGAVGLLLWRGTGRSLGLLPILLGLGLWAAAERPLLLISQDGRLFGYETEAGRVLSSPKGNGYAAETWLRNDGDLSTQATAWDRARLERRRHRIEAQVPGIGTVLYVGATDASTGVRDCAFAAILIAPHWSAAPEGPCSFVGADRLARDGALAVRPTAAGVVFEGSRAVSRGRAWTD